LQSVEFRVWGLQTKVEQWLQKSMVRDVLTLGHKQAFCWIDDWFGLTMDDIRKIEEETKLLLDKMRNGESASISTTNTTNDSKEEETEGKGKEKETEKEEKEEKEIEKEESKEESS